MEPLYLGSTGPNVKLIQSLLGKLGYDAGGVDGLFGAGTQQAIIRFQSDYGLTPDGVVGPITWSVLERLLLGYDSYTVRPGDTMNAIAQLYHTTVNAVMTANPGINPQALEAGQRLVVPYGIDVVQTDIDYTYEILHRQLRGLKARYPFLEIGSIGASVMGKSIFAVRLGFGPNRISYNAAHHANEWITTTILMKFIEDAARAYSVGGRLGNYSISDILNRSSIYIIPMVNPDGVDMVTYWPNWPQAAYQRAAALNTTGLPIPSVWKANIRGTDLNLNYPALWDSEHALEQQQGIIGPAPREYGGPYPLSEPETAAMANFTRQYDFRLVIAYHTQGKVIFYQFENLQPPESTTIVQLFSRVSGYAISDNPDEAAYAGYKDWFIYEYRRPGFTVEAGIGVNPLPISQFNEIYRQNEEILLLGALV